jgi:hypothetical protein
MEEEQPMNTNNITPAKIVLTFIIDILEIQGRTGEIYYQ